MSGLRFAIEFSIYVLACLIAVVSFVYINYVFIRKSFYSIINILISYIFYFFMLPLVLFLPIFYIRISRCFPSSIFSCDDFGIILVFWYFIVLPLFVASNISLFIILIIKILAPKKDKKPKNDQNNTRGNR